MAQEKDIPFIKGRRVGPDAIVSRDEQWAARVREVNPPREEWLISTYPMHFHRGLTVGGDAISATNLELVPLPSLGGILDAVATRMKIFTQDAGKHIRTCIYEYAPNKNLRNRVFKKVPNSECTTDVTDRHISTPLDTRLNGVCSLKPGKPYFLAWRGNSEDVRVPISDMDATSDTTGHFPIYYMTYPDERLPVEVRISHFSKRYTGGVPWITYISNDALQLL
jgi:hypothetical protein